jgi:hypothetical protein
VSTPEDCTVWGNCCFWKVCFVLLCFIVFKCFYHVLSCLNVVLVVINRFKKWSLFLCFLATYHLFLGIILVIVLENLVANLIVLRGYD